jgi:hypothetical protein
MTERKAYRIETVNGQSPTYFMGINATTDEFTLYGPDAIRFDLKIGDDVTLAFIELSEEAIRPFTETRKLLGMKCNTRTSDMHNMLVELIDVKYSFVDSAIVPMAFPHGTYTRINNEIPVWRRGTPEDWERARKANEAELEKFSEEYGDEW